MVSCDDPEDCVPYLESRGPGVEHTDVHIRL